MKKIQDAAPMRNDQILAFRDFKATIPADVVAQWHQAVELWEADSSVPNPFKAEKCCEEHRVYDLCIDSDKEIG